jgi:hypothetical protein
MASSCGKINGADVIVTRIESEEQATRFGFSVGGDGLIRGRVPGSFRLGNLFVVQSVEQDNVIVYIGNHVMLVRKFGGKILNVLNGIPEPDAAIDTDNFSVGLIRGSRRELRLTDVAIKSMEFPGAIFSTEDIGNPSYRFKSISMYGRSPATVYARCAGDRYPHSDRSEGKLCISTLVTGTAMSLVRMGKHRVAAMMLLEGMRRINCSDCYGHFRRKYEVRRCRGCNKYDCWMQPCERCRKSYCRNCRGENAKACRECVVRDKELAERDARITLLVEDVLERWRLVQESHSGMVEADHLSDRWPERMVSIWPQHLRDLRVSDRIRCRDDFFYLLDSRVGEMYCLLQRRAEAAAHAASYARMHEHGYASPVRIVCPVRSIGHAMDEMITAKYPLGSPSSILHDQQLEPPVIRWPNGLPSALREE